jgi:hypothetical protein
MRAGMSGMMWWVVLLCSASRQLTAPNRPQPPPNRLQRRYNQWLTAAANGTPAADAPAAADAPQAAADDPIAPWRPAMYAATGAMKRSHPEDYRDRWEDAASLAAARAQMAEMEERLVNGTGAAAVATQRVQ